MNKPILSIHPLGFPWKTQDPFLFCVYHKDDYPKGNEELGPAASLAGRNLGQDFVIKDGWRMYHGHKVPGFPSHPHRGFETVTIVNKGFADHSDSLGATARFGEGDVQWLTSGKGLQHSEMFPLLNKDEANPLVLFQLWLNLPKKDKMVDPHFKMLWSETIPIIEYQDNAGGKTNIQLIAGKIGETIAPNPTPNSWAANPENEVAIYNITMEAGATWTLPIATEGINRSFYYYQGDTLDLADLDIQPDHAVELNPSIETVIKNGPKESRILILQGKPINEPIAQHGPFVMNSKAEIMAAFQDYQRTQFGGWPWGTNAPVHAREKGRFAKHIDGTVEIKEV